MGNRLRRLGEPWRVGDAKPSPITYTVRDNFDTPVAAGSVNGSAADPGPGTRVVNDTGNQMSIANGELVVAGGSGAWGDPGLWYGNLGRALGKIAFCKIIPAATTSQFMFGWDNNQTTTILDSFQFISSGRIFTFFGAAGPQVGLYQAGVYYDLAVILRANGAFFLIRGGAFTKWTLLWDNQVNALANAFPGITSFNAAINADDIMVPATLWWPTPEISDTFDRADGAIGISDGGVQPEADGVGKGVAWQNKEGTWAIASNVASPSALASGLAIATGLTNTADIYIDAVLARAAGSIGIVLRYVDDANYIYVVHNGTNLLLVKRLAGVETTVQTTAVAIGAGALRVICDGTSFDLFLNGAKVGTTQTITDLPLQTSTQHGLYSTNTGNSINNFLARPRGSGGEYGILAVLFRQR